MQICGMNGDTTENGYNTKFGEVVFGVDECRIDGIYMRVV